MTSASLEMSFFVNSDHYKLSINIKQLSPSIITNHYHQCDLHTPHPPITPRPLPPPHPSPLQKADTVKEEIVSHWHPNLTINVVHDFTQWTPEGVPAPLEAYVQFTPAEDR